MDPRSLFHSAVKHAAENDNALIRIIDGIKDQRFERRRFIPFGRRNLLYDLLEHRFNVCSHLRRNERSVLCLDPDDVLDFIFYTFRLRARQIDLIDDRHDLEIVVDREVTVGKCLRLDPLRRVHDENSALAGSQASGNLIIKIDMARRVDQIKYILFPVFRLIYDTDCLRFYRDPPLALQFHIVKHLRLHLPLGQQSGLFYDPVRKRRFPVVNVGNNAKISYIFLTNF